MCWILICLLSSYVDTLKYKWFYLRIIFLGTKISFVLSQSSVSAGAWCACEHTRVCQRYLLFLRTGSHWNLGLVDSAGCLATEPQGPICLSTSLVLEVQECTTTPSVLGEEGIKLGSSCLLGNHFILWPILPVSEYSSSQFSLLSLLNVILFLFLLSNRFSCPDSVGLQLVPPCSDSWITHYRQALPQSA